LSEPSRALRFVITAPARRSVISESLESLKEGAKSRGLRMFGRNTVASTIAFGLDLLILWCLVELLELAHIPAGIIDFLVPLTVFYILSREWVFPGTRRGVAKGYLYFLINVGLGFVVMLAVFWALLHFAGLFYLVARVLASVVSGILVFFLNGILNFKQL
jgi:putative flippase GtrA